LTAGYDRVALDEFQVPTMNGNTADGFQWFGRKASEAPPQTGEKNHVD
jgi:hypothetical protein